MGFRGSYSHSFDAKGRIAIPARFREKLSAANDDRVVLSRNFVGEFHCVDVYPHAAWLEFEAKVEQKYRFDQKVARFRRYYFSHAQDCTVDKQGRILVSQHLRDYAALKKDVLFVSDLDKFQLWDPEVWEKVAQQDEAVFLSDPDSMSLEI